MTFIKQFSIISIIIIIISFYSNIVLSQDTDEKYYFKGTFGTSSLTVAKSNSIGGVADVLITRSSGSYKFNYNVTLSNFDGTDIFSTKIMGPSAPNKDDGSLKLTLAYSTTDATKTKFVASGSQTVAFNSPSYSLIAPILMDLASNPSKSNYANEQFYVVVNTISGGTSPVTRAQLLYTGASNLPNAGGGTNPNGSSDNLPTTTPLPNSSDPSDLNKTSSDATPSSSNDNEASVNESTESPSATPSATPSSSSSSDKNGNGNINPGGVETSTSNPSSTTSTSKDNDSSTGTSVLPTILIVSLFVLTLVAMS